MGKVQSDTTQKMKAMHGRGVTASPAWAPERVEVTVFGPQPKGTPCVIIRAGEDPEPTCVNPHCPKTGDCQRHIQNRTDPRTPSIAIITWYKCGHYVPLSESKKNSELARLSTYGAQEEV